MLKNRRKNTSFIITFFLITLLFKPLWLFNNNDLGSPGDDMSYWLHSATLAFDQDLDYLNDYSIESSIFNSKTNVPIHPPGAGYLSSPFVFLFSQLDKIISTSTENTRTNPVKSFAYIGFFIAGLFYTYIGIKLLSNTVKKYNNNFSGLLIFCGLISTLIHFVSTRFLMAHAVEFFLCCALIYVFENNEEENFGTFDITKLFLIYFFLSITRPSTFLYSLILFLFYRRKFILDRRNILIYIFQFLGFSTFYVFLARLLYQKNYILLNAYGSEVEEYTSTLNIEQLVSGFLKIPNLFFSTNMGVIFSAPIVLLALIVFFKKNLRDSFRFSDKFFFFLYLSASFIPLLIWQGREVAYGQRLLIGIIPICILITCKYLRDNVSIFLTKCLTFFTYLGYLFFYSSQKLTLKPGTTLWGTQTGFTAENYYIEVIKGFLSYETLISVLLRNIYAVDIFKFFNLRNLISDSNSINNLSTQNINKFLSFTDDYYNLENIYLLIVNITIFLFSYYLTKLLFTSND